MDSRSGYPTTTFWVEGFWVEGASLARPKWDEPAIESLNAPNYPSYPHISPLLGVSSSSVAVLSE
ncbi:MAG: hypothetical protein ACO34J_03405 [Prochlorothrix sp.]